MTAATASLYSLWLSCLLCFGQLILFSHTRVVALGRAVSDYWCSAVLQTEMLYLHDYWMSWNMITEFVHLFGLWPNRLHAMIRTQWYLGIFRECNICCFFMSSRHFCFAVLCEDFHISRGLASQLTPCSYKPGCKVGSNNPSFLTGDFNIIVILSAGDQILQTSAFTVLLSLLR